MVKILLVDGMGNTSLVDAPSEVVMALVPLPRPLNPPEYGPVQQTINAPFVEFRRTRMKTKEGYRIYRMNKYFSDQPHVNIREPRTGDGDDVDRALHAIIREEEYKMGGDVI